MPQGAREVRKQLAVSGQALGAQLQIVEAQGPADFDRAFSDISAKGPVAFMALSTPAFDVGPQRIVDLAAKNRLPAVYASRSFVDSESLMLYGPNLSDLYMRAAGCVEKILKGAKSSDLPIEQPTKFELLINLGAKTLGLTIPPSLLTAASEVIE
jgi:putative tryptophan/tyrosine transport system substrate-binding protein